MDPYPTNDTGRQWRSKKDRPCDHCRSYKHACKIIVRGEPCRACEQRRQPCTFNMPSTPRVRKPPNTTAASTSTIVQAQQPQQTTPRQTSHQPQHQNHADQHSQHVQQHSSQQSQQHNRNEYKPAMEPPSSTVPLSQQRPRMNAEAGPSNYEALTLVATAAAASMNQPIPPPPNYPVPHHASNVSSNSSNRPPSSDGSGGGAPSLTNGGFQPATHRTSETFRMMEMLAAASSQMGASDAQGLSEGLITLDNPIGSEEDNFVSLDVYSQMTLSDIRNNGPANTSKSSLSNGSLVSGNRNTTPTAYQQLSGDSKNPVWFVKSPSLLYGNLGSSDGGRGAYEQAVDSMGGELATKLIPMFLSKTLSAFPILNSHHLQSSLLSPTTTPYSLLVGIFAHMTSYVPSLLVKHKDLWALVLQSLEYEFQQPRLQTVQLALLILTSRPAINSGQNTILTAKAIGAAQLLGLHLDPGRWRLPRWERNVRKRVMWGLLIHDKWRALMFGRPSNLHPSNYSISIPTIDDVDPDVELTPSARTSMQAFTAMCELTLILETLLDDFFSVAATFKKLHHQTRLRILETASADLQAFGSRLPAEVASIGRPNTPSGVYSLQLAQLGLKMVVVRLMLAAVGESTVTPLEPALPLALGICTRVVEFIEMLKPEDYNKFWMPYSPFHLMHCASLILRVMILSKRSSSSPALRQSGGSLLARLLSVLHRAHHNNGWDVASLALDRTAGILRAVEDELTEVAGMASLFAPNRGDQTPTPGPATPAAPTPQNETAPSPQGSAHGQNSNMPWWMDNDIAALPAGFDWSADAFDGWFSFEDTSGLGMNHMNHGEV